MGLDQGSICIGGLISKKQEPAVAARRRFIPFLLDSGSMRQLVYEVSSEVHSSSPDLEVRML
jgi:hypothetical protein